MITTTIAYTYTGSMKGIFNETNYPKTGVVLKSTIYWVIFIIFLWVTGTLFARLFPSFWLNFVYGIGGTLGAFLATWIMLKIEKRSFAYYGLIWQKRTLFNFFKGLIAGTLIFLSIIAFLLSFTDLQLLKNPLPWNVASYYWYLFFIPLALMEEIAFRAYPFLQLKKAFGIRATQYITAIVFALYHILNGWDYQVAFLGPGTWAFVFGLAAVWSKGIAVPTGIHVALNVIQQVIGIKVGETEPMWILQHKEGASAQSIAHTEWMGIISQILILIVSLILTEYYIRNKQVKDPV